MRAPRAALAVGVATVALAIAGCGGGSDTTGGGAYGGSATSADTTASSGGGGVYGGGGGSGAAANQATGAAVVSVADNSKLGQILVDSKGFTLYDFHKDKGGKSACYGACAKVWTPLTTNGTPKGEKGAKASLITVSKRTDGTTQVAYANHPLYTYAGDSQPGQANGNDFSQFGGQWYALTPSGEEPKD